MKNSPLTEKSINIIKKHFKEYVLIDQDILENKENKGKILALVPEKIHDELQHNFQKHHSSSSVFAAFVEGCITVLIDLQKVDQFDPLTILPISSICHGLHAISTNEEKNEAEMDIKHGIEFKERQI